jgi:ribose transport system substrate-binding protein
VRAEIFRETTTAAKPSVTGTRLAASVNSALRQEADVGRSRSLRRRAASWHAGELAAPAKSRLSPKVLDEMNRLFEGQPVSGFVAPVHLVTAENLAFDGGTRLQYDPDNGYRAIYRRIWKR